jgi:hypothetical protein
MPLPTGLPATADIPSSDPELRLRRFDPDEDAELAADPSNPPDHVLEFQADAESLPEKFAFYKSDGDLAHFHRDVVEMLSLEGFRSVEFVERTQDEQNKALHKVATATHKFIDHAMDAPALEVLQSLLRDLLDESVLRVSSDSLPHAGVPWPALHFEKPPSFRSISASGFLGGRLALAASFEHGGGSLAVSPSVLDLLTTDPAGSTYGFVDDPTLKSVKLGLERDCLRSKVGRGFDPLHILPPPNPDQLPTLESVEELADYLAFSSREATHFACHGGFGEKGAASRRYAIRVRQNYPVDSKDLKTAIDSKQLTITIGSAGRLSRFIWFNVCRSARDDTSIAAKKLEWLEPETLVATLGDVCDLSAAKLAVDFYGRAIGTGAPVGKAFVAAIKAALTTTRNPTHLLFLLQGDPHLVLQ